MFKKTLLFFHTVKYLKVSQIIHRIRCRLIKPKVSLKSAPNISRIKNNFSPVINCSQKLYNKDSFIFLNHKYTPSFPEDWNAPAKDKLWLFNLHYFDDLNSVDSEKRKYLHFDLIQRWINDNPVGYGLGWESYPMSLRIVNWIKWSLINTELKKEWLDSLVIQTRFLNKNLEYHLLGNHLFSNAKALIFSGIYFQGSEANDWYNTGMQIFNEEISEQVLGDGGNFELSPMYHSIFIEDLLDIVNIHQSFDIKIPDILPKKIYQMLDWLVPMTHPDGKISFFNDSTLAIAPTLHDLLDYSGRLNLGYVNNNNNEHYYMKDSGYFRVARKELSLIADVAEIGPDYLPGHGHADTLSFELSLFNHRVVVNSGISTYETNDERHKQRGTETHSTITVDGENSSEVWSSFRVAKRAKVFDTNHSYDNGVIKLSACHDGYTRLKEKVVHCREWIIGKNSFELKDTVTGNGNHELNSVLPLHPKVTLNKVTSNSILLNVSGKEVLLRFLGKGTLLIKDSKYHSEFGLSIDNKNLIYQYNGTLPFNSRIKISW